MKRKTFMLIVPWMVPGGGDRCGVDLLRHFRLEGWRTVTVATRENPQGNLWRHEFARWSDVLVDLGGDWRRGRHIEALHSAVQQVHPRIICINNSHEAHECIRMLRKQAPDCLISTLLHMDIPGPWDFPGKAAASAHLYDRILCVSDTLASSVRARIPDPSLRTRVSTLHWFPSWPPSRPPGRASVRAEIGVRMDEHLVISPMRVCQQKNPMMVLEVAGLMPSSRFIIAGDGDMAPKVAGAMPHNASMTGYIENSDMPGLLAAADCVFLPSRDEGIPLALMEAMEQRVPVVASDVGGVRELVNHATGACLHRDSKAVDWREAIAASMSRTNVGAAEAAVRTGAFSFGQWREGCRTLLDDSHIQKAPLVRVARAAPLSKVFIIGAPKTGTSSVGSALELMGCRVKGFDPVLQDYYHHGHTKPALEQVTLFDAFADGPYNTGDFYKVLHQRFPGARFILTLRDEEPWSRSHEAHFSPSGQNAAVRARFRMVQYDPEEWLAWYRLRNDAIRHHFRESRKLLLELDIFRLPPGECWSRIAGHVPGLRCPPAGTPFPHTNRTVFQDAGNGATLLPQA